jgi:hypothetical protein
MECTAQGVQNPFSSPDGKQLGGLGYPREQTEHTIRDQERMDFEICDCEQIERVIINFIQATRNLNEGSLSLRQRQGGG